MLDVKDLHVYYGKLLAVKGISFSVNAGQLAVLLGANGTGKTTILNAISGFISNKRGVITYKDKRIDHVRPDRIMKDGMVQVSQNRDLFPDLSVADNLDLGAVLQKNERDVELTLETVYEYFPILRQRKSQLAGSLSGGEQQMLAIGRALMSRPTLMLLDEPTTGLAPLFVESISNIIKTIHTRGTTILWAEQNAIMALSLADYYYILRDGQIVKEGTTVSLPSNIKDYLKEYYI